MEKFFTILGKLVLIILLFGSVAYGSYYIGQNGRQFSNNSISPTPQNTPTSPTPPLSPTSKPLTTILGGVDKKAGLSFLEYALQTPDGWVETRESQTPSDEKLILTNGDYEISIFQAATGGAMCLYPGDPDFEGPGSRFTVFQDLKTKDGLSLRRSGTNILSKDGRTGFTVCQKSTDGSFGQPTTYGHISYSLPNEYTKTMLLEMDQVVSSLTKI